MIFLFSATPTENDNPANGSSVSSFVAELLRERVPEVLEMDSMEPVLLFWSSMAAGISSVKMRFWRLVSIGCTGRG